MNKAEWRQIAPLLLAWPQKRDEPVAHAVYETVLARFEPAQVADTLRDLALTARHMPTAAEVAQHLVTLFPGAAGAAPDRLLRAAARRDAMDRLWAEDAERVQREAERWLAEHPGEAADAEAWAARYGLTPTKENR